MSHDPRATSPAHGSAAIVTASAVDPRSIAAPGGPIIAASPGRADRDGASGDDAAGSPAAGPRDRLTDDVLANDEQPASPVVAASFSIQGFVDGWIHCQHVADYLARFAASDRFDPEQLTTRLSTYLNEALELVFRSHLRIAGDAGEAGDLAITIHRRSDRLQVELRCPLACAGARDSLRRSVRRATGPDAAAEYRRGFAALLDDPAVADGELVDDDAGLLELVALHGISLALREADDAVVLCMTVPHE